ncbi:hypothetical protein [Actinomadura sp. 3N508]
MSRKLKVKGAVVVALFALIAVALLVTGSGEAGAQAMGGVR